MWEDHRLRRVVQKGATSAPTSTDDSSRHQKAHLRAGGGGKLQNSEPHERRRRTEWRTGRQVPHQLTTLFFFLRALLRNIASPHFILLAEQNTAVRTRVLLKHKRCLPSRVREGASVACSAPTCPLVGCPPISSTACSSQTCPV